MLKEVRLSREEKAKVLRVLRKRGLKVTDRDLDAKNLAEAIAYPVARNIYKKMRRTRKKPTYREIKDEIKAYMVNHKKFYSISTTSDDRGELDYVVVDHYTSNSGTASATMCAATATQSLPVPGSNAQWAILTLLILAFVNAAYYAYVLLMAIWTIIKLIYSKFKTSHPLPQQKTNLAVVGDVADSNRSTFDGEIIEGEFEEDLMDEFNKDIDRNGGRKPFDADDARRTAKTDVERDIFDQSDAERTAKSDSDRKIFDGDDANRTFKSRSGDKANHPRRFVLTKIA